MKLDVYRSCSFREKREVLDAFWRTKGASSPRIEEAARQYGPYAVVSLVVIALELAVVLAVSIDRGLAIAWIAGPLELVTLASTWWAVVRDRALRAAPSS